MPAMVRKVLCEVTFAGNVLPNVIGARGEVVADRGWPTCSVFLTAKPPDGNEENEVTVVAGAENVEVRFIGRVRRFRASSFPKSIEMYATGTLAYAEQWAPSVSYLFGWPETDLGHNEFGFFPSGGTDTDIVQWVLGQVPGVTYDYGTFNGTGKLLGFDESTSPPDPMNPDAFDWRAGMTAWQYVQNVDRATLYRTYQGHDGQIHRVKMIGHPDATPDFTLTAADILDGAQASRDTERTRNAVEVRGYDYGNGWGPLIGRAQQENDFQGDEPRWEVFSSGLIQSGNNPAGELENRGGLNAVDLALEIIYDVNKEFVEATVPSWRDDLHGPGMTCLLDALDRLAVGEPMWVARHAWEVGDSGWISTYGLTGGGLPQSYPTPPI